ncbi:MAG: Spy/CpxP family protein refolding chaperone [Magnetococcales bacterium]|nr:Spy/CpxP family protein refolding chaperone [Magnetococcales bacterium]
MNTNRTIRMLAVTAMLGLAAGAWGATEAWAQGGHRGHHGGMMGGGPMKCATPQATAGMTCPICGNQQPMMGAWSRGGNGGPMGMGFQDPIAAARQLDLMKQRLAITPQQETAWKAYADAVTKAAAVQDEIRTQHRAQYLVERTARMERHLEKMEKMLPLQRAVVGEYKNLQGILDANQQKNLVQTGPCQCPNCPCGTTNPPAAQQ